jgi:predicted DNA-binding transcriptional regulator AlpA
MDDSLFLTKEQLAGIFRCSTQTIDNRRKAGLLPKTFPTTGKVIWRRKDIEKYIEDAD